MREQDFKVNLKAKTVTHISGIVVTFDDQMVGEIPVGKWSGKYSIEYLTAVADIAGKLYHEAIARRHQTKPPAP